MSIRYRCPKCNSDTTGLFPTFDGVSDVGVHYICTCEICLNRTCVLTNAYERVMTDKTVKLKVDRFCMN